MSEEKEAPRCRCGDEIKLVDLRTLPFGARTGPRYVWQHVEKMRNFSHQARLATDEEKDNDG